MNKFLLVLASILPFFIFTSCTDEEEEIELELTNIRLNVESLKLEVGDTYQFEAITSPSNYPQDDFIWTVVAKDDKIGGGYIDDTGLFTATKSGKVIVEVMNHEIRDNSSPLMWADAIVTILGENGEDEEEEEKPEEDDKPQISNISFSEQSISIKKGETAYIDYTIQPSDADASGIRWNVSDNSIISITSTSNGRISINALKSGEAEVYTTVNGKRYACQVTVEAIKVERIELNPSNITLNQGESIQLEVSAYPNNADNIELIYESSDTNIARVSSEGYITAITPGTCIITVSTREGVKADCEITVIEKDIKDLIDLHAGVSVKLYNNGYLTGKLSARFINHSDKRIKMVSFYMYDTLTNQLSKMDFEEKYIEPFGDFSMTLEFSDVYKPMFEWKMECENETFSKTYVSLY